MEHRTQIHLSHDDYRRAVRQARARSLSLAGVVREALAEYLAAREAEEVAVSAPDPIDRLLGLCPAGPGESNLAEKHDDAIVTSLIPSPAPRRDTRRRKRP